MDKRWFCIFLVAAFLAIPVRAQMLTNPVQDYINKTNLLNNILSNKRATDMSQKAQPRGQTTNKTVASPPGVSLVEEAETSL